MKRAIFGAILLTMMPTVASADYILNGKFRAPCKMLPPIEARQEPDVPYEIKHGTSAAVHRICSNGRQMFQPITACAITPKAKDGVWIIHMPDFLSPEDYACVLMYEKAHLPPNSWKDQAWEDQGFRGTVYVTRKDAVME